MGNCFSYREIRSAKGEPQRARARMAPVIHWPQGGQH